MYAYIGELQVMIIITKNYKLKICFATKDHFKKILPKQIYPLGYTNKIYLSRFDFLNNKILL